MNIIHNPAWIKEFNYNYKSFADIPSETFSVINQRLDLVQSKDPLVSIVIAAWNEEVNILRSIASLSKLQARYPFEIIVVNNNSSDRTQDTLDKLHIKSYFQEIQGAGPARQLGQEKALGKYILTADADCLYPSCWLNEMIDVLKKPGVVCVYGRYSFISEPGLPRWKFAVLESMKDAIAEFRHLNRPYFNTYGISMGYVKEYGLKIGFIKINRRGEDGQLCLDLMKYGKVKQVRSNKARVWTGPRTLQRSGNFAQVVTERVIKELKRFRKNFDPKFPPESKDPKFSKPE